MAIIFNIDVMLAKRKLGTVKKNLLEHKYINFKEWKSKGCQDFNT